MTTNLRHWYDEARKRDDELRQGAEDGGGRPAGPAASQHDFNNVLTAIRGYAELTDGAASGDARGQAVRGGNHLGRRIAPPS